MAFIAFCEICKKQTAHGDRNHSGCLVCKEKKYKERKKAELEKRGKMNTKKRIKLIEAEIYDMKYKPG